MIVPMRHVTILCLSAARTEALDLLQELGLVHLNLEESDSPRFREAQAALGAVQRARLILSDAVAKKPVSPVLVAPHRAPGHVKHVQDLLAGKLPAISGTAEERIAAILLLADLRQELVNESSRLNRELERYTPFGAFDVAQFAQLTAGGIPITLFRMPLHHRLPAAADVLIHVLVRDDKHAYGVRIGPGTLSEPCEVLDPPEAELGLLRSGYDQANARVAKIGDILARDAADTAVLDAHALRLRDQCDFASAADTMRESGPVLWITGWMPASQEPILRETASGQAWGLLLRDPEPDDKVPTLLRPPRLFRPMLALFDALGISPAYSESDISVPFFCFFAIFFAMLVGDGGYGALILLLTAYFRRKFPAAPRAPFVLLTVFSLATVAWGALSNTWFGGHPQAADNAVSLWLGDPEKGITNTMLVCFSLGVAHLSIARLWNTVILFPDSRCLAQLGWVGVLGFMYCMACSVVGIFSTPDFMYYVFVASLALVFLFSLKRSELKTRGVELGMMPLTIVGCLGDIISYVRLFAVGLASVKVAENFNAMALGLDLPVFVKIVPLVLILLIGHGLNFAMAGLSILVHAVRLNTLEFSNHKGISWAGFAFRPFKRRAAPRHAV